jgi:MerR family transcriptional regulator, redox-sensitive transcriptional activator SoxR
VLCRELSVGEVAARSGVPVSTLHFYEAKGLVQSRRTAGNQRRYGRDVLRRAAIIKVAQRTGLSLAVIHDALATLPPDRVPGVADWRRLSESWRDELDERIARLDRLRDRLEDASAAAVSRSSIVTCEIRTTGWRRRVPARLCSSGDRFRSREAAVQERECFFGRGCRERACRRVLGRRIQPMLVQKPERDVDRPEQQARS